MDRRLFLLSASAAALSPAVGLRAQSAPAQPVKTRWVVRTSEGFDALGLLSPLSGDPFYARHYEKELTQFASKVPAATIEQLKALKAEVAETDGLMSPAFYLWFSAGPDSTLEDLYASIADPQRLRPVAEASPYWDGEEWQRFVTRLPRLKQILTAIQDAGFRQYRNSLVAPVAATKLPALREKLADYDVIRWAEFYTGRALDPTIEVIFMHFNKPHGIKIIGQRYLTGLAYDDDVTIRTAGHEMLHPPVPMDGAAAKAAMSIFEDDPLLQRILAERDKSYGYGSIEGLFNEGLTQALDQLIGERLGIVRDSRERWRKADGGMHVLAAAFYGLLKAEGYDRTGGNLEQWVTARTADGSFAPPRLHAAAGHVLGYPADTLWPAKPADSPPK